MSDPYHDTTLYITGLTRGGVNCIVGLEQYNNTRRLETRTHDTQLETNHETPLLDDLAV